jgi:hypothetical protein
MHAYGGESYNAYSIGCLMDHPTRRLASSAMQIVTNVTVPIRFKKVPDILFLSHRGNLPFALPRFRANSHGV